MISQEVIEAWSSTAAVAEQVIKVPQSILKQARQTISGKSDWLPRGWQVLHQRPILEIHTDGKA